MQTTIVLFQQNLRVADNPSLVWAAERGRVVPLFIWDENAHNQTGAASRWWLQAALHDLQKSLARLGTPLIVRRGVTVTVLQKLLQETGAQMVAWQRRCEPALAVADMGTAEALRKSGVEVVSSADLVQQFEARWTAANLESHLEAGRKVDAIRRDAFRLVGDKLRAGETITEFAVKQFIRERFAASGLVTDHGPIVGANENSSNPHYEPQSGATREIRRGDWLLIDMWAKADSPEGVYYDITWTGFCGAEPPAEIANVFGIVTAARDCAVRFIEEGVGAGRVLRGFEVDDAARAVIRERGFGEYFFHRTGHSIGAEVHGSGANMDNLETHDVRRVIPWTCFSIEPGIYLPQFGIRSEVNVFVGEDGARVTGEIQDRIVLI